MKRATGILLALLLTLPLLPHPARAAGLEVAGKSAVLMDAATGTVLYESNPHEKLAPASVTKVMTMLLIMEAVDSGKLSLDDTITASEAAAAKGGSQIYLKVGETMTARDMLKSIAVSSANDCACAMAEHLAGSEGAFVKQMNRRAGELESSLPQGVLRLLKFGFFQSGTVRNALSAHTRLEGSLRAYEDNVFDFLQQGLGEICRQVEQDFGCTVQLHMTQGYPAVWNPEGLYRKVRQRVDFRELEAPSMTAEDFSWYQRRLPGLFFFLGVGDTPALHADTFDFDDAVLEAGADFFEELAEKL